MTDPVAEVDPTNADQPDLRWPWYLLALATYVALGVWLRSAVLNWIVGPFFLLFVFYLVPRAVRSLTGGARAPVSWAAHEFENYFLQKHAGLRASFLAIAVGTLAPDLFTKAFVYNADDPAQFHRGWPGVGFTHSLSFGVLLAVVVLAVTRSRSWALGILIGQWAHVLTDIADTAGVMIFFPFSTETVSISMWKHAAVLGRYGDASAYYSSLGGVWDLFWLVVLLVFARQTLRRDYFRNVIVPADPRAWGWLHRRFRLPQNGLLLLYRGLCFYGLGRLLAWFLQARFRIEAPLDLSWGGPYWVEGNDLSDTSFVEVAVRTAIAGAFFAASLALLWVAFVKRLWLRAEEPPALRRTGVSLAVEE